VGGFRAFDATKEVSENAKTVVTLVTTGMLKPGYDGQPYGPSTHETAVCVHGPPVSGTRTFSGGGV